MRRPLAGAISKTAAAGEIDAIDGGFGSVTITMSIHGWVLDFTGVDGAPNAVGIVAAKG